MESGPGHHLLPSASSEAVSSAGKRDTWESPETGASHRGSLEHNMVYCLVLPFKIGTGVLFFACSYLEIFRPLLFYLLKLKDVRLDYVV